MRLLFVIDPPAALNPRKDSSIALMRAAARLLDNGEPLEVFAAEASGLISNGNGVSVRARLFQIKQEGDDWYEAGDATVLRDEEFGAVFMRLDPPVDLRYKAAAMMLETMNAPVFNEPQALLTLNEKLSILRFPQWIPPTIATADKDGIAAFCEQHGGAVIKPLDGMGGQGIYVSPPNDMNLRSVLDMLGGECLMAQQYLPAARQGDARVFVINGKPMEWMLVRQPRDDDHRSNLAAGGKGVAKPLSGTARKIAEDVGKFLTEVGVSFAGLDVIGEHLTEINITCPTGLCEVRAQTGEDYAEEVIRTALAAAK